MFVRVEDAQQRKQQDIVLVVHVLINQAAADTSLSRDVQDRRAEVAPVGEQFDGGGNDLAAPLPDKALIGHCALDGGNIGFAHDRSLACSIFTDGAALAPRFSQPVSAPFLFSVGWGIMQARRKIAD